MDFFEASYWAYYYDLDSDEFWTILASNDINFKEIDYI